MKNKNPRYLEFWRCAAIFSILLLLLLLHGASKAALAPEPNPQPSELAEKSASIPQNVTIDPWIQGMIGQVISSTLATYVGDLSGKWPVTIDGSLYTMATRSTNAALPIGKATEFGYEHFQSLGLSTRFDSYLLYNHQERNVVAEQKGLTQPERIFLLTAHLDSTSESPDTSAPGADDNASGSSAVLQAADVLSKYPFGCTLRYILFTGEEQGLVGSYAYAREISAQKEKIEGFLNMDMLGYNTPGSERTVSLHTRKQNNSGDLAIANLFKDVTSAYGIDLLPSIFQDTENRSDHYPLWIKSYPGILAIEDDKDFTPYYHTTNDQLATLDLGYYTAFVKAAVGTFAHMGCLLEGEINGTVKDAASGLPLPGATAEARLGNQVIARTTTQADGSYHLFLDPGAYDVSISAADYKTQKYGNLAALRFQPATLDASLQPCIAVSQANFTFNPGWPALGENITFTGSVMRGESSITYSWDFGDGSRADGAAVTHSYASKGGFPVKVTADNACEAPVSALRPVYVQAALVYFPLLAHQP